MKTKINGIIAIILIIASVFLTLYGSRYYEEKKERKQTEKKATNDSIVLLNRLWMSEYQRFQSVMTNLDSISKNGGVLTFTNKGNKVFELTLKPKQ